MRILCDPRVLRLGLASVTALPGQVAAREIIRNAVVADARTAYPAEGRDALNARLNRFAKAIIQ